MAKINLNTLAKKIADSEGGKQNLSIAQIKEVVRLTLVELRKEWNSVNEEGVISAIKGVKE